MAPGYPQREAAALAEAFGGPAALPPDSAGHAPQAFSGTEAQRARWVTLATGSADEAGLPADPEFRAAFTSYLEWSSRAGEVPPPKWDWGPACPPTEALAQPSADDQEEVTLPGADQTVSFAAHIKPLFREHDRKSMAFAFDLWSLADVQAHAAAILERLQNGHDALRWRLAARESRGVQALDRIRLPALGGTRRFPSRCTPSTRDGPVCGRGRHGIPPA